jgi:hypothetical protein
MHKCELRGGEMRRGLTDREREIIRYLLAQRGIGAYEIVRPIGEGTDLPGSTYEAEVEKISGYIATATSAYYFWLVWYNGDYSLDPWSELDPPSLADSRDGDMVEIVEAQQRLRREEQTPSRFAPFSMTFVQERRKALREGRLSGREEVILRWFLEKKEITTYEIVGATPTGRELPGSVYPGEVESWYGYVVTATAVYFFQLDWLDGHYTLGEEDDLWQQVNPAQTDEQARIVEAQERLLSRE